VYGGIRIYNEKRDGEKRKGDSTDVVMVGIVLGVTVLK
jgi:hypothetical protein